MFLKGYSDENAPKTGFNIIINFNKYIANTIDHVFITHSIE